MTAPPPAPSDRRARLKRTAQILATVLVSTLLTLSMGEAALRILRPKAAVPFQVVRYSESERGKFTQYHPTLGWVGKPDADDDFEKIDASHHVHQNHWGFRGATHPLARSSSSIPAQRPARRIVVLGDSVTWGYGVEDDEIFTSIMERKSPAPLEVVNLGVSGYGTDQEYLLWQLLGRQFTPDDVLLVVTLNNDLIDISAAQRYGYPKPVFQLDDQGVLHLKNVPVPLAGPQAWQSIRRTIRLQNRSRICQLASHCWLLSTSLLALSRSDAIRQRFEAWGILLPRIGNTDREDLVFHARPAPPANQKAWALFESLVQALDKDTKATGARLTVVVAPGIIDVYPEFWAHAQNSAAPPPGSHWDRDAPRLGVIDACRRIDVPVIDLTPGLIQAARTDPHLYYEWNEHWTPAGHRVVAGILLKELGRTWQQ